MAQGIEYHVRAILSVQKAGGASQISKFTAGIGAASASLSNAGRSVAGNLGGVAKSLMAVGTAAAAAVGGLVLVKGIKQAVGLNAELEASTFSIASTLQLMSRNGGDFTRNMEEGKWVMDELFERAATSPASFDQASTLFKNMLPGAAQVTQDMERILDMSESALTLGIQMGGDFKQAGADLRRIITGQAGADVRAWVEGLRTPIQELARAKFGIKSTGDAFVKEFNKMDPAKRFELVEAAVQRLGPATAAAGLMWSGLTSTVQSDVDLLLRDMGRATFEGIKSELASLVTKGGLLDPKGETMAKLSEMATFMGDKLSIAADYLIVKMEKGVDYVSKNWRDIIVKLRDVWDRAVRAAKLMAAATAARRVVGGAMMAGGAAGQGVASGISAAKQLAGVMSILGGAGLIAAPILAVVAVALVGVGTAFAGVAAFFIENWDMLVAGMREGSITLGPLLDAFDLMWVKLLAVGQSLMGTSEPAGQATVLINGVTQAFYWLMGAMSLGMRTIGWLQQGFLFLKDGFVMIYLGMVGMVQGILFVLKEAVGMLPTGLAEKMGLDKLEKAYVSVDTHAGAVVQGMKKDFDKIANNDMIAAADAFDKAFVEGKGATSGLRDELDRWKAGEGKGGAAGAGGSQASANTPKNVTNINKLVINQDLRGSDPDRVIGAFYKSLDKTVRQRTQPLTSVDSGI